MTSVDLELSRLLRRTLGLNPQAVQGGNFEEVLQERMTEHGVHTKAKYLSILKCSRQERLALVESVLLPIPGFFQHADLIVAMQRWVTNHWFARPSKKPLRVLSVPCATGEEPYSLAITLLENGLQPTQFHVDAADINDFALRRAAAALYPESSLKQTSEPVRERYFVREPSGYRLCPSVRSQVSFLKADFLGTIRLSETYDIIFGQSLMRFFVPKAQQRILKRLEHLLKPGGLLIVGPAHGKTPRRTESLNGHGWPSGENKSPGLSVARLGEGLGEGVPETRATLREAAALLDAHRCHEAAELCIRVLEDHRASAQAVFLLGRIAELEGRQFEAREFFRRALYLQPRHRQAQEHLKHLARPTRARKLRA